MINVELTIGERFKDARIILNQHGKQTINDVAKATNVSASLISDLENDKDRRVGFTDVVTLANHYGVSTDYLINGSELYSKDIELNSIAKYTGLSIKAIKRLHMLSDVTNNLPFLSEVIVNYGYNLAESLSAVNAATRVSENTINDLSPSAENLAKINSALRDLKYELYLFTELSRRIVEDSYKTAEKLDNTVTNILLSGETLIEEKS